MSKVKIFTHKDDMDGRSCPIILCYLLNIPMDKLDISYEDYHSIDDSLKIFVNSEDYKNYTHIYITDLGIKMETAEKINRVNSINHLFLLYDHHDTNYDLNKFDWCLVKSKDDEGRKISATKLIGLNINAVSELPLPEVVINFICLVSDYDTYLWKDENNLEPKKLHDLFNIYGSELFRQRMLHNINMGDDIFTENDLLLLDVERERISRFIDERIELATIKEIYGYKVATVYSDYKAYTSELGNTMCERLGVDIAAMISMAEKTLSFRSISNDFHLGKDFASKFGGGGHDKSAGADLTSEFTENVMKQIFGLE